jgi:hypothetical protein
LARPQGGRPAAVFFPLGYPFPYGPVDFDVQMYDYANTQLKGGSDYFDSGFLHFGRPATQ